MNKPEIAYTYIYERYTKGNRTFAKIPKRIDNRGSNWKSLQVSRRTELEIRNKSNELFKDRRLARELQGWTLLVSSTGKRIRRNQSLGTSNGLNTDSDINIHFLETNKANKVKENANKKTWQEV